MTLILVRDEYYNDKTGCWIISVAPSPTGPDGPIHILAIDILTLESDEGEPTCLMK